MCTINAILLQLLREMSLSDLFGLDYISQTPAENSVFILACSNACFRWEVVGEAHACPTVYPVLAVPERPAIPR